MVERRADTKAKPGIGYRIFRQYLRLLHNYFYYRKVYWIGRENIPEDCPLMVVSDHQNGLADPLGVLMSIRTRKKRKIKLIARADVFKPAVQRIMAWLGVLPAFRLSYDGEESLANNMDTFDISEDELLSNGTVVIYPEAGHQDKRWLGKFSHGYLRIVFEAARKSSFEKDIQILPSCNHYSSYFGMREQMLIRYGTPISAAPYYELYKTKPRTAQRQLNAVVWQQVSGMMLNITDLDSYEAIDYLRETYGVSYAKAKGYNPKKLPEKLQTDKQLVAELDSFKLEHPEQIQSIYSNANTLREETARLRIQDSDFDKPRSAVALLLKGVLLIALLPLFIAGCIPNMLTLYVPRIVTSKIDNRMQHSGINFAINALITIPISYLIVLLVVWLVSKSILIVLACLVILPFLGTFAWMFKNQLKDWLRGLCFYKLARSGKLNGLVELRNTTYKALDLILSIEHR